MGNGQNRKAVMDLITFTEQKAYIYSYSQIDLSKATQGCMAPRPQQKRHYLFTRYWGGEYVKDQFPTAVSEISRIGCEVNRMSAVNRSVTFDGTYYDFISSDYIIFNLQGKKAGSVKNGCKLRKAAAGVYISQWLKQK